MALTQTRLKQVKARLISGKILDLLEKHNLLNKRIDIGMHEWENGKKVMVHELKPLSLEEQEELEEDILEQIRMLI